MVGCSRALPLLLLAHLAGCRPGAGSDARTFPTEPAASARVPAPRVTPVHAAGSGTGSAAVPSPAVPRPILPAEFRSIAEVPDSELIPVALDNGAALIRVVPRGGVAHWLYFGRDRDAGRTTPMVGVSAADWPAGATLERAVGTALDHTLALELTNSRCRVVRHVGGVTTLLREEAGSCAALVRTGAASVLFATNRDDGVSLYPAGEPQRWSPTLSAPSPKRRKQLLQEGRTLGPGCRTAIVSLQGLVVLPSGAVVSMGPECESGYLILELALPGSKQAKQLLPTLSGDSPNLSWLLPNGELAVEAPGALPGSSEAEMVETRFRLAGGSLQEVGRRSAESRWERAFTLLGKRFAAREPGKAGFELQEHVAILPDGAVLTPVTEYGADGSRRALLLLLPPSEP